jgi:hypothetical protein
MVFVLNEYYSAIKKNEMLSFAATWIESEDIILSEISQAQKDKDHISSFCEKAKKLMPQEKRVE